MRVRPHHHGGAAVDGVHVVQREGEDRLEDEQAERRGEHVPRHKADEEGVGRGVLGGGGLGQQARVVEERERGEQRLA